MRTTPTTGAEAEPRLNLPVVRLGEPILDQTARILAAGRLGSQRRRWQWSRLPGRIERIDLESETPMTLAS